MLTFCAFRAFSFTVIIWTLQFTPVLSPIACSLLSPLSRSHQTPLVCEYEGYKRTSSSIQVNVAEVHFMSYWIVTTVLLKIQVFRDVMLFCSEYLAYIKSLFFISQHSSNKFYIHGSVHHESNLITVQKDATYSVYYISVGSSTCFEC